MRAAKVKAKQYILTLALGLFIATPAAAQTPPTVDISATNDNGDREADTRWPGLQVNEGDTVTISITPSTPVTGGIVVYTGRASGSLSPGDINDARGDPAASFGSVLTGTNSFSGGGSSANGLTALISIRNDSLAETDETLTITISNLQPFGNTQGFMLGTDSVTFTVRGTDTAPAFGTVSPQIFYKGAYTEFQLPVSGGNGPISCTATNLPTGLTLDQDGSGSCSGLEPCKICGTLNSPQTVTITASDADSNTAGSDQRTLTFTINTPRHPADITDSNGLDVADALLLFQHYSGARLTGDQATRGEDWKENGQPQGGDLNGDRSINQRDALIMYYAYEFGNLLNNHPTLRQLLLNGVRGQMPPTDATYRELLRRARGLR